jgi:uncharacterized protein
MVLNDFVISLISKTKYLFIMTYREMKKFIFTFLFKIVFIPVYALEISSTNITAESEGYAINGVVLKSDAELEKRPAIIFLVGSGGTSSHTTDYRNFVNYYFEEVLLDKGFAIVYFDKRGVESSEGVWYNTTFEQRALDAKHIAMEVARLDFIDDNHIYLVGHSQGGWIAQIAVASWPELFAGAISMAGPTYGVRKQIIDEYHSRYICNDNLSEDAALRKATRNVNRDLFFISFLGWTGNWKQLRIIRNFEADGYIRSITKPFLFMFAENDELVNPKWAMEDLEKIFPGGPPPFIETYTAAGQNHSFRVAPACYRGEWDVLQYSESTRNIITEWLTSQVEQL